MIIDLANIRDAVFGVDHPMILDFDRAKIRGAGICDCAIIRQVIMMCCAFCEQDFAVVARFAVDIGRFGDVYRAMIGDVLSNAQ